MWRWGGGKTNQAASEVDGGGFEELRRVRIGKRRYETRGIKGGWVRHHNVKLHAKKTTSRKKRRRRSRMVAPVGIRWAELAV
jgi:hypothetical protein